MASCPKPSPKPNGFPCIDHGQCRDGQCQPFCRTKDMIPCACDDPVKSCMFCCQKDELSQCEPFRLDNQSTITLPDGRPCIYGQCMKGQCERQIQDMVERFWSVIEKLTPSTFVRFMKDNIVLTVVFLSMIVWIPCSCAVSYWDRKRNFEEEEEEKWMHPENNALVSHRDRVLIRPSSTIQRRPAGGARVGTDDLPPKPGYRADRPAEPSRPPRDEVHFRDQDEVFTEDRYVPRHQPGTYYRPSPRGRGYMDPSLPRTNHPDGLDRPRFPDPAHYYYPNTNSETTVSGTRV